MENISENMNKIEIFSKSDNSIRLYSEIEGYSIEILKSYLESFKNYFNKTDDEKEKIFGNILEIITNLSQKSFFKVETDQNEADNYFINEFAPKILDEIWNTDFEKIEVYLKQKQISILEIFIKEFNCNLHNPRFFSLWEKIATENFLDAKPIYKARNNKTDIGESFFELNYEYLNPNQKEWSKSLKIGDNVDVLVRDKLNASYNIEKRVNGIWTRGEIIDLDENKSLKIKLLTNDEIINLPVFSCNILPYKTLSLDYEWRESLSKFDEIDILDNKTWYLGTVMEAYTKNRGGINLKMIRYGVRVYKRNASKKDTRETTYIGFSEEYDKEVSVHDIRIRKPKTFSRIIENWECAKYSANVKIFSEVETYFPFEIDNKKFYAIGKRSEREIDIHYINMINSYGRQGGFDKFTEVLSNHLNFNLTFDQMSNLISIIVEVIFNTQNFLHVHFCKIYLTQFIELCLRFIKDFANYSENRNFKKEKLESILKKLKEIMGRVYIEADVQLKYELFIIEFSIICLKSNILEKKILGHKMLTESITNLSKPDSNHFSSSPYSSNNNQNLINNKLNEVLRRENILEITFGPSSHLQIVQKSSDLMRAYINSKLFEEEEIKKLYMIYKDSNDVNLSLAIHKIIKDNIYVMDSRLQKYLLRVMLDSIDVNKKENTTSILLKQELEIILSLHQRLPLSDSTSFNIELGNYFRHLLFNTDNTKIEFYDNIISETISLLKSIDFRESRINFLSNIIKKLKDGVDVMRTMKVLRRLVTSIISSLDEINKNKIINQINDEDVLNLIIEYLELDHITRRDSIENMIKIEGSNYGSFEEQMKQHSELIVEFFSFMNFLSCLPKKRSLIKEQINCLYAIFVANPIKFDNSSRAKSLNEINQFFKFLKDSDEKKMLPNNTFSYIFDKMASDKNLELDCLSLELMKILWGIFVQVNKDQNRLIVIEATSSANKIISSKNNYSFNPEDFDAFNCSDSPFALDGFELIYKSVISSQYGEVSKSCISNFIQLFKCSNKIPNQRQLIWNELIKKIITDIDNMSNNLSTNLNISSNAYANKILNLLGMLKSLIQESEKKGTAGVIPHSSINTMGILSLKITTSILNIPEKYKNFSIKVFYNTTVWDLKKFLGKKLKIIPETITLQGNKEIADADNGKTLIEMKFKQGDTLTILKNSVLERIEKVSLFENGTFTMRMKSVLNEIFQEYANCNKIIDEKTVKFMSAEDLTRFIRDSNSLPDNQVIYASNSRIVNMLEKFDDDYDGMLTVENFIEFYKYKNQTGMSDLIWSNLKNLGYRNDLRKMEESLEEYNSIREIMPRWIISKEPIYFKVIFDLQFKINEQIHSDGDNKFDILSKEASKFLNVICTNPVIYKNILMLEQINDWNLYIERDNYYKQLYSLQIIESFFEDFEITDEEVDSEPIEMSVLEKNDRKLLQPNHKMQWLETFLGKGGLEHIINIFINNSISVNDYNQHFDFLNKKCLCLIIKIIRSSIIILIKANNLTEKNMNIQIDADKNEIIKKISKDSTKPENALKDDFIHDSTNSNMNIDDHPDSNNISSLSRKQSAEFYEHIIIKNINEKYGHNIIHIFLKGDYEFKIIIKKILEIISNIITNKDPDEQERSLLCAACNLFSLIYVSQNNLAEMTNYIFNNDNFNFEKIFLQGLLINEGLIIRANFYKTFKNLAKSLTDLKEYEFIIRLINIVQNKIFNLANKNERKRCRYLFLLEEKLISFSIYNQIIQDKIEIKFDQLAINLSEKLRESECIEDTVLLGYLKIFSILVKYDNRLKSFLGKEQNIFKILINKYMIKEPRYYNIAYKGESIDYDRELNEASNTSEFEELRNSIFDLIINLCEDNLDNILILFDTKISQIPTVVSADHKNKKRSNNYNPMLECRSQCGFVGIKNLGCICYMNSILQQFFNIPSFRNCLLNIYDNKSFTISDDNTSIDDNILHQLQKMFTFLLLSNRISYNPSEFCFSYRDFNGLRTKINQQQDAEEFLRILFDRIESNIKHTPYRYLLQSFFGGKTCSQNMCTACGNTENRFEDFCNLSLEVKNFKTLKESLDKFTSEENIEGYRCEKCNKTTTLSKRNTLSELPNILIIHLQRIGFNYDSGRNEKVNSKLEFPKELNLKSYCVEAFNKSNMIKHSNRTQNNYDDKNNLIIIDEEPVEEVKKDTIFNDNRFYEKTQNYYEYKLVGVVIHSGHADAGHYFSYINTNRDGKNGEWRYEANNENWLNFNDAYVSPIDLSTLEENSFGGNTDNGKIAIGPIPSAPPGINGINDDYMNAEVNNLYSPININEFESGINSNLQYGEQQIEIGQSAYMLVYERIKKTPIKLAYEKNVNFNDENCIKINDQNRNSILKAYDSFNEESIVPIDKIFNMTFIDENKNEIIKYIPFYEVLNKVPLVYYMEVVNDNIEFYNDQKIFNEKFNEFLVKIIITIENILKSDNISNQNKIMQQQDVNYIFEVILSYIFEVISKSNFKRNLYIIFDKVNHLLDYFPFISASILNYLNNNKDLNYDILFSFEERANLGYKNLLISSIKNNLNINKEVVMTAIKIGTNKFDNSNLPPCLVLLDNLIDLLPSGATKYWTKMLSYLEFFDELVTSGDALIIEYFLSKNLISKLIDFFLGKDSPLYSLNENRQEMGNLGVNPKFAPLISCLSNLVCNCETQFWNEEIYDKLKIVPGTFTKFKDIQFEKENIINEMIIDTEKVKKIFKFSEVDSLLLYEKKFYVNAMKDNYNNTALSKLISHLMFNNLHFTKECIFWIFEVINRNVSLQETKNIFDLLSEIVKIQDDYTTMRFEWLFGIPQIIVNINNGSIPSLPLNISRHGDKRFKFVSYIINNCNSWESLTERLLYKFYSSTDYLQMIILFIKNILFPSPKALLYFDSLPHPKPNLTLNTSILKARDFLFELANEEISRVSGYTNVKTYENAINNFQEILIIYNNYIEESLNKIDHKYKSDLKMQEKMFNHTNKLGAIFSDVIYLCDNLHVTENINSFNNLNSNNLYLICIDMEVELKPHDNSAPFYSNSFNKQYDPPEDGCQILSNSFYAFQTEDSLCSNLCNGKLNLGKKFRRIFKSYVSEEAVICNTIRRFIIYNTSNNEYRVRFKFHPKIKDKMNCYIPNTELFIICNGRSGKNVISLLKSDAAKDYGDYTIEVEVLDLKTNSPMLNTGDPRTFINLYVEDKVEKVIQKEPESNDVVIDEVPITTPLGFDIICAHCNKNNFFKNEDSSFSCRYCQRDVFG